jgi:hypothetical protein
MLLFQALGVEATPLHAPRTTRLSTHFAKTMAVVSFSEWRLTGPYHDLLFIKLPQSNFLRSYQHVGTPYPLRELNRTTLLRTAEELMLLRLVGGQNYSVSDGVSMHLRIGIAGLLLHPTINKKGNEYQCHVSSAATCYIPNVHHGRRPQRETALNHEKKTSSMSNTSSSSPARLTRSTEGPLNWRCTSPT